jgi:hypothetical protein
MVWGAIGSTVGSLVQSLGGVGGLASIGTGIYGAVSQRRAEKKAQRRARRDASMGLPPTKPRKRPPAPRKRQVDAPATLAGLTGPGVGTIFLPPPMPGQKGWLPDWWDAIEDAGRNIFGLPRNKKEPGAPWPHPPWWDPSWTGPPPAEDAPMPGAPIGGDNMLIPGAGGYGGLAELPPGMGPASPARGWRLTPYGWVRVRSKRMNVLNPRALRRAQRRIEGFTGYIKRNFRVAEKVRKFCRPRRKKRRCK